MSVDGVAMAHSTNGVLNMPQDFAEFSSKSAGRFRRYKPGKKGTITFSVDAMVAYSDTANFSDIYALYLAGAACEIRMAGLSGDKYYMADTCYVESINKNAPDGEMETFTAVFRVDGMPSEKTLT